MNSPLGPLTLIDEDASERFDEGPVVSDMGSSVSTWPWGLLILTRNCLQNKKQKKV